MIPPTIFIFFDAADLAFVFTTLERGYGDEEVEDEGVLPCKATFALSFFWRFSLA